MNPFKNLIFATVLLTPFFATAEIPADFKEKLNVGVFQLVSGNNCPSKIDILAKDNSVSIAGKETGADAFWSFVNIDEEEAVTFKFNQTGTLAVRNKSAFVPKRNRIEGVKNTIASGFSTTDSFRTLGFLTTDEGKEQLVLGGWDQVRTVTLDQSKAVKHVDCSKLPDWKRMGAPCEDVEMPAQYTGKVTAVSCVYEKIKK